MLNTLLCWLWESLANEVDFQIIVSLYIRFLDDYLIFFDVQTGVEKLKACFRSRKQSRWQTHPQTKPVIVPKKLQALAFLKKHMTIL